MKDSAALEKERKRRRREVLAAAALERRRAEEKVFEAYEKSVYKIGMRLPLLYIAPHHNFVSCGCCCR